MLGISEEERHVKLFVVEEVVPPLPLLVIIVFVGIAMELSALTVVNTFDYVLVTVNEIHGANAMNGLALDHEAKQFL